MIDTVHKERGSVVCCLDTVSFRCFFHFAQLAMLPIIFFLLQCSHRGNFYVTSINYRVKTVGLFLNFKQIAAAYRL